MPWGDCLSAISERVADYSVQYDLASRMLHVKRAGFDDCVLVPAERINCMVLDEDVGQAGPTPGGWKRAPQRLVDAKKEAQEKVQQKKNR